MILQPFCVHVFVICGVLLCMDVKAGGPLAQAPKGSTAYKIKIALT